MSGVTTSNLILDAALLGIAAAQHIAQGYREAGELRQTHEAERAEEAQRQADADSFGLAGLEQAASEAEARLAQFQTFADRLGLGERLAGAKPQPPEVRSPAELAAYVRQLEALIAELRPLLLTEAALQGEAFERSTEGLAEFAQIAEFARQSPSARLLARIAHLGEPPEDIAQLAREFDGSLPGERADLLATELRLRIHTHLKACQAKALQAASALVIEQSLKDLGYEVEPCAHTLCVEGQAVHFRRPGWGDYMVRMRLDFTRGRANFNVIRAVDEGDNERSLRDHLAEDRWCAEFPALQQSLAAQGVLLQVERRLAPGELPVQLVVRDKLPAFSDEDRTRPAKALKAREMP